MTIDRIYFAFMVLVGIASGAILVAFPAARDFYVAPYFWVLIAVALFEFGAVLLAGMPPLTRLGRVVGFFIGIAGLVAVAYAGGAPLKFF